MELTQVVPSMPYLNSRPTETMSITQFLNHQVLWQNEYNCNKA